VRLARRIVITLALTLAAVFACVGWIAPVALSFYAAKEAPAVARVVPTDLKDQSVSQTPGTRLSYVGYEFEVPWSDLDKTKTAQYPKDKPNKTRVVLTFRSGLRLMVTAVPAGEWVQEFTRGDFRMPRQTFEAVFGHQAAASDYNFVKALYGFTPDKMHYWALSTGVHYREQVVLLIKSTAPSKPAETGIFNVRNQAYKGFQQGDPQIRQDNLLVNLYSDEGSVEIMFLQKAYHNPAGVTQPEINRIVQSLHQASLGESAVLPSG
jgi:hypothetical protein